MLNFYQICYNAPSHHIMYPAVFRCQQVKEIPISHIRTAAARHPDMQNLVSIFSLLFIDVTHSFGDT